MVMEYLPSTLLCPICLGVLKISTSEPHPTSDRADVVTYRCSIHGDVCATLVNQSESVDTELATFSGSII